MKLYFHCGPYKFIKIVVGYIDLEQKETYKKLKIEVSDIVSDTGILIMLFNKLNTALFNRNYSQNSKAITFRKIINHTTYTWTNNVPCHLHIFWLNFKKANHSFLHPFVLGPWGKQIFKKLYLEFWVGNWGMSKNA